MNDPRRLLLIGLIGYVTFVIVTFPASTALGWFGPGQLGAAGVEGSIWRGRAAALSVGELGLGESNWRFRPLAMLGLRAGWHFNARRPDGFLEGDFAIGPTGRVRIAALRGALPLSAAGALLPQPRPSGELTLQIAELRLVDGWPQRVDGAVNLGNLIVNGEAIGSYRVDLSGEGRIDGRIRAIDGPLDVEGRLNLTPERQYEMEATISARAEASARLQDSLRFLPSDPSGRRVLIVSGSF